MTSGAETFAFLDDLRLEVNGSSRTLRHYRGEYGRATAAAVHDPELRISFRPRLPGAGPSFGGGHKSVRWRVELPDPTAASLQAAIALTGEPRSFGLSLLQGYVIEPLLGLLAPAAGHVLLPSAAIAAPGGTILLIGRSRSGKSSLSARAAAAGIPVLGDDHVLLGRDGMCRPFPRRLRLYSDLPETAPMAYRALPRARRALLGVHGLVRAATRGAVAPPLRVPIEALGTPAQGASPLDRVVVIERAGGDRLESGTLEPDALVEIASAVLGEQRAALRGIPGDAWTARLEEVRAAELRMLGPALGHARSTVRLTVPNTWEAARAVSAIAAALDADL
ncbi:MAG TPA: hypothetical protein VIU16_12175 [Gaiellaceae bacterium]